MNYVKSFNLLGVEAQQIPCIELNGVPTENTEGAVGLLGMDVTSESKDLYKCVSAENGVYSWERVESTIDQSYNAESEHAQSGKAVAEALEPKANKTEVANALKGKASGEVVGITDISPIEHNLGVKVSSKNIINADDLCGKQFTKNDDGSYTFTMGSGNNRYTTMANIFIPKGSKIVFSITGFESDNIAVVGIQTLYANGTYLSNYEVKPGYLSNRVIKTEDDIVGLRLYLNQGITEGATVKLTGIQLEYGTKATAYTPYVDVSTIVLKRYGTDETDNLQEYTPNADGTVEGVKSIFPNTRLMTDTSGVVIDCEYNKDINKAFDLNQTDNTNTEVTFPHELGALLAANGTGTGNDTRIRTIDFIPLQEMYLTIEEGYKYGVFFYDENKKYLSTTGFIEYSTMLTSTAPDSTAYVKFVIAYTDNSAFDSVDTEYYKLHYFLPCSKEYISNVRPSVINDLKGTNVKYKSDVPENIGVLNAILNAKQLTELKYTPEATIPHTVSGYFVKGTQRVGVPYSSTRPESLFVPNNVSFHTFMTATQNPNSYLYTVDLSDIGNQNGNTYYGAVCSTLAGYALGIVPNYSTHQWADIPDMEVIENQSAYGLKLCDTIVGRGHVVMVTDITRNDRGKIGHITITEAINPVCKSTNYTPEELEATYPPSTYKYCRYKKLYATKHYQSPYVAVEDEIPQVVTYNTTIIPRKGDKANWLKGTDVEIDVLEAGNYTGVEVYKDETSLLTANFGNKINTGKMEVHGLFWDIGGILSASGSIYNTDTRIRTGYMSIDGLSTDLPDNVQCTLFFFDETMAYINSSEWLGGSIYVENYTPESAKYVRIVVRYTDDSPITNVSELTESILVSTSGEAMPLAFQLNGLQSSDGAEIKHSARARTGFIPLQDLKINPTDDVEYYIYFYDENKGYIGNGGSWMSSDTVLLDISPEGTAYVRFVVRYRDNSDITAPEIFLLKVQAYILSGREDSMVATITSDLITLSNLEYGSYKARLTDGNNVSDWCYWMVVDATSTATPIGSNGEVTVTFSASNAEPLWVQWTNGTHNGTVHITPLSDSDVSSGTATCSHEAGSFKVRAAFRTEYGIIHSELPDAITVV